MATTKGRKPTPSRWTTERGLAIISAWGREGLNVEQISKNMGICKSTLYVWSNKHHEIMEALNNGRTEADMEVENALFLQAKGYWITEEQIINGEVKKVRRWMKPDTVAQIYWTKNRRPDKWRDKSGIVVSTTDEPDDPFSASLKESFGKQ